ncbi:MAG: RNA polymerase sigma factor [Acidobacteriota bacterium]
MAETVDATDEPAFPRGARDLDGGVLRSAQAGEAGALDELGRHASRIAFPFALQLLGQRDLARDVAQDSLVRLFASLESFDSRRPVEPWLRRIVRNRAIDVLRRLKVRRHEPLELVGPDGSDERQVPDPRVDVAAEVQRRERQRILYDCLQVLSDEHREIVVLRDYQDLSYEEIGDLLGIPKGTVMSRLHRARKALQSEVERRLASPGPEEEVSR